MILGQLVIGVCTTQNYLLSWQMR